MSRWACTLASTRLTIPLQEGRGVEVDVENPRNNPAQIAPVVTWLASAAAQDITGQIIDVMQGWVGIMQQPAVLKSCQTDRLWSLDDLDRVMPQLMDAKRAHDERTKIEGAPEKL